MKPPTWYSGGGCIGTLSLLSLRLPFSLYALLYEEMQLRLCRKIGGVDGLWLIWLDVCLGNGGHVGSVFHLLLVEMPAQLF